MFVSNCPLLTKLWYYPIASASFLLFFCGTLQACLPLLVMHFSPMPRQRRVGHTAASANGPRPSVSDGQCSPLRAWNGLLLYCFSLCYHNDLSLLWICRHLHGCLISIACFTTFFRWNFGSLGFPSARRLLYRTAPSFSNKQPDQHMVCVMESNERWRNTYRAGYDFCEHGKSHCSGLALEAISHSFHVDSGSS
jgi:hypothetical protein